MMIERDQMSANDRRFESASINASYGRGVTMAVDSRTESMVWATTLL